MAQRSTLLFHPAPGARSPFAGRGFLVDTQQNWSVSAVVRCLGLKQMPMARAVWGPDHGWMTQPLQLTQVDPAGVWAMSGGGDGPAPAVFWVLADRRLLLEASITPAPSWLTQAVARNLGPPSAPAQPAAQGVEAADTPTEPAAANVGPPPAETEDQTPPRQTPPPVTAEAEAPIPSPGPDEQPIPVESAEAAPEAAPDVSDAPSPASLQPPQLTHIMAHYPSDSPFVGLLPGARFVRVPFPCGQANHYIVGYVPVGGQGFYMVGVPGSPGWQAPPGLPQHVHYLPSRSGQGYWVRYLLPDGGLE